MRKKLAIVLALMACNTALLSACELSSVPRPISPTPTNTETVQPTSGPRAATTASPQLRSGSSQERARRVKWQASGPGVITSAAAVGGDAVYFSDQDGALYAVQSETGQLKWNVNVDGPITGGPILANSLVALVVNTPQAGGKRGYLTGIKADTGREVWRYGIDSEVLTSPAFGGGLLYFGGADGFLYAVDAASGKEKWRLKLGGAVNVAPIVVDGVVYTGDKEGGFYAVDGAAGRSKWTFHAVQENGSVSSTLTSAAIADGIVYFGSVDWGRVYALDAATGKIRWQFKDVDPTDPPYVEPGRTPAYLVTGPPTLAAGVVYIGISFGQIGGESPDRKGYLYALDAASGKKRWKFRTETEVLSAPAVGNRTVYFASKQGILQAVDVRTAQELWRFEVDAPISASPVLSDNILYFGTWAEGFYALRLSNTN